jgi:hypothetical protein
MTYEIAIIGAWIVTCRLEMPNIVVLWLCLRMFAMDLLTLPLKWAGVSLGNLSKVILVILKYLSLVGIEEGVTGA